MLTQELRVERNHDAHPRECKGTLFLAAPVETWLRELCSWNRDMECFSLYLCPSGNRSEPSPSLLVLGDGIPENVLIPSIPLQNCGDRLYYPSGSELLPRLTPQEIENLPGQDLLVVLPRQGVIRYREMDSIDPAHLITLPPLLNKPWLPVPSFPLQEPRFLGTEWFLEESPEDMLDKGKDNIGEQKLKYLPETERDELRKKSKGGRFSRGIANVVFKLTQMIPESTDIEETWVNRVEKWATKHLRQHAWENQSERDKEVQRLLDMLKENPLQGLRYAIPLSGLDNARGKASPGNRLSTRDTNFNLRMLGGGEATDPWHIHHDARFELTKQYRELARKEESNGEYRRAAYIYGQLLGDIGESARVLERGKYYIEAGELWLKKLNKPTVAAKLFAKGGQIQRAIELYVKHGARMEAVKLYRQIDCEEDAISLLEEEVQVRIQKQQYIQAAELVELEFNDEARALEILSIAWPHSPQALKCKLRYMKLTLRFQGQKGLEREWLKLEKETKGQKRLSKLTLTLHQHLFFSMKSVEQEEAYDRMLRIAHPWLHERDEEFVDPLLEVSRERGALRKDLFRYIRKDPPPSKPVEHDKSGSWKVLQKFKVLPNEAVCHSFVSSASKFAAIFIQEGFYRICVGNLAGFSQVLEGSVPDETSPPKLLFHPSARFLYILSEAPFGPGTETVHFPDGSRVIVTEGVSDSKVWRECVSSTGTHYKLMYQGQGSMNLEESSRPLDSDNLISKYPFQVDERDFQKLDLSILRSVPCVLVDESLYFCKEANVHKVSMFEYGESFLLNPHPCSNTSFLPIVHLKNGLLFSEMGMLKELGACKLACITHKGELLVLDDMDRFVLVAPHQPDVVRILGRAPVDQIFMKLWSGIKPGSAGLLDQSGDMWICEF